MPVSVPRAVRQSTVDPTQWSGGPGQGSHSDGAIVRREPDGARPTLLLLQLLLLIIRSTARTYVLRQDAVSPVERRIHCRDSTFGCGESLDPCPSTFTHPRLHWAGRQIGRRGIAGRLCRATNSRENLVKIHTPPGGFQDSRVSARPVSQPRHVRIRKQCPTSGPGLCSFARNKPAAAKSSPFWRQ